MAPPRESHGLNRRTRVAGVLPWLAVLALTLSELYIRLTFGRWPRVYRDSPESPFSDTATTIAVLAALSSPAMITVALLLPVVRAAYRTKPVFDRWVVSSGVGATVLHLLTTRDPYGFLNWAFD